MMQLAFGFPEDRASAARKRDKRPPDDLSDLAWPPLAIADELRGERDGAELAAVLPSPCRCERPLVFADAEADGALRCARCGHVPEGSP